MSAPSEPTAQLLKYADEVDVNVAHQQVNLVDLDSYGHRVSVAVLTSALQNAFSWTRAVGSARPVGHFSDASGLLQAALAASLNTSYTDTDAVAGKLSFDSATLTSNTDPRIREGGNVSANDLLMAYVLYKVYGSSTANTSDIVFNLQDAYGMLTTADYAAALIASFNAAESHANAPGNEKGAVDAMFRDLLAADPLRFFDASGNQVTCLFEVNTDASGAGNWNLVEGDKIEVRTKFTFLNSVTLRTSTDVAQNLNPLPTQSNDETVFIEAGSSFYIRLQLTASDSGPSGILPPPMPVIVGGQLTGYTRAIPASVTLGSDVTSVSPTVFTNSTTLTTVDMSASGITTLPIAMFNGCTALTSALLPTGLTTIGNSVFNGCSTLVAPLTLPASMITIGTNVFTGCTALTTVTLASSLNLVDWTAKLTAAGFSGSITGGLITAPYAPQNVSAISGNASIAVSWSSPSSNGGAAITGYKVFLDGTLAASTDASTTSANLTGLTNGSTYSVTVKATNANGDSLASTATSATPTTIPDAPQSVSATASNAIIAVSWSAPSFNGGASLTGYNVFLDGTLAASTGASTTSANLTGLMNATTYSVTVKATNANGDSLASTATSATPTTIPDAPQSVSATASNASIAVSWSVPSFNGGASIMGYKVFLDGTLAASTGASTTSANLTGLTNATSYSVTVKATNANGDGTASTAISAIPNTIPSAPQNVSATAANLSIMASWSAPSNGGSAITGYKVYLNGTLKTSTDASTTSANLTGLINGTSYSMTVKATNANGDSEASTAVSAIPSTTPSVPQNVTATAGNLNIAVSWSAPSSNGGSAITGYKVFLGGTLAASTSASITSASLTGLTNGQAYNVTVKATNANGDGTASTALSRTPITTVPSAPQNVSAVGGNTTMAVSWSSPSSDGGLTITGYKVFLNGTLNTSTDASTTSASLTGLTNSTIYSVTVTATNSKGDSTASTAVSAQPTASIANISDGVLTSYSSGVPAIITLDSSVTAISATVFQASALQRINLSSTSITSIEANTFSGCASLININLPEGLLSIGSGAFSNTSSLQSIVIPNSVTSIGSTAFFRANLYGITLPSGLLSIGEFAFRGCNRLQTVNIPSGVTSITANAFYYCTSLYAVTLQSGILSIGYGAFYNCNNLQSINLPSGLTTIGAAAFESCWGLSSIIIPSSMTNIEAGAFGDCIGLNSVTIPASFNLATWTSILTAAGYTRTIVQA